MQNADFFKDKLFGLNAQTFEAHALSLFRWQAANNPVYRKYISHLGIQVENVGDITEIPFLPISFFKNHQVVTEGQSNQKITYSYFESSGTTGQERSRHFLPDTEFYLQVCEKIFEAEYGVLQNFHVFALLPSYLEREHASLVAMADDFIKKSQSPLSGFYLHDYQQLLANIEEAQKDGRQVLLLGVTFALLDLAEQYQPQWKDVIVMETGGMKGRRKEMIRQELHQILKEKLHVDQIHAEYGMTELLSQAYATKDGIFHTPPWMKVLIRDINDPFTLKQDLRYGGINIIDLANVHSCAFLETQDLGKYNIQDDSFEVLGRFDHSDIRGCNLMVSF